ncbi:MAG TPA: hypothetical protein VKB86_17225 [Pyrinomonadaceae bacterium]|nr:hypothetical protein [Pyrinomonadaceae bacterium]
MHSVKTNIISGLVFLFLSAIISDAKEWRGLVPLKSTRADVERLLGKPGKYGRYQFDNERANIYYAEGSCNKVDDCRCLVPSDVILEISVDLEVEMRFSTLNIDRTKYKKKIIIPDGSQAIYSNDEEGIIYTVDEVHDDVISIEYLPSAKDCQDLIKHQFSESAGPSTRVRANSNCIRQRASMRARRQTNHAESHQSGYVARNILGQAKS